ncbi:hypothetical protein CC85DRAFT_286041 [Cutaneotrichosporon oleaginosum]|uniref:Chromatin assembly factor 1 subunit A n=1 Tax=Cutaneotrichosporon oleaginosum TaxID=879819 RepID=A0A0J1B2H1_9TREE|nr:uncharacterized protein CC85DRAFT_286041 [Cutaneotrichosporon oleaginosum]KLT41804.1 hypothetical protein CC85DRAFT_286041 [Cutaneotrichosporon oleaginosum]TXT14727.1 hypothetical protein COLE_00920 [Cutaneotrichosporon oleaginosum]
MNVIDLSMLSPVSDSPSSPPPPPGGLTGSSKRKADAQDEIGHDMDKRPKLSDGLEVKSFTIHLSQDPYQRSLPRRRLLNFEGWLLDAEEAGTPLTSIPDEFHDLVAMAGHEQSAITVSSLVKSIKAELVKGESRDTLRNELLTPLVEKLFSFKQYGFRPSDFSGLRVPTRMQIRCWEVNDLDKYFPADRVLELKARRAERERAREEVERMLASMDSIERNDWLRGEKEGKEVKLLVATPAAGPSTFPASTSGSLNRATRETSATSSRDRSASPSGRGKKLTSAEKEEVKQRKEEKQIKKEEKRKELEAKEVQREEKRKELEEKKKELEEKRQVREEQKAEKERAEQKKAEVKTKQASMFSNFFKKAPPPPKSPAKAPEAGPSKKELSDFERAFPPVAQRANVHWAPINRFQSCLSSSIESHTDVATWTRNDFLRDHLERHKQSRRNPRSARGQGLKSEPMYGSVAEMWAEYQRAEEPRAVLDELTNKRKFPWKTLAFDQQARPPYVGTFSKRSLAVGPRTPFAQDPVFDYSYDSGDDWQEDEEEGGDDVDEPVEDGDDDVPPEDEGEFDDWLDNTEDPIFNGADADTALTDPTHPASPKKRVPVKRITKLTPTWTGPIWENVIAETAEGHDEYRIQLLNDTPSSIDPFKYQSSDVQPQYKTTFSDTAVGNQLRVRCLLSAQPTNTPHYAPARPLPSMPLGDASSSANKITPKGRTPKVAFPEKLLPEFLRIVDGNTRIMTDLVSHLKIRFDKVTTKAAIEAKIREVAVREGKSKDSAWKVKPEAWAAAGVTPPMRGVQNGSSTAA